MTHEEAIEIIKKNCTEDSQLREACKFFIPELRESEDERIRKELIDFVNHYRHNTDLTAEQAEWCKKALAYLEKQKEPNAKSPSSFGDDETIAYHFGLDEGARREREKQIKQRPAEWSEEDEKLFWGFTAYIPDEELERLGITRTDILMKLKSIRPQPIQLKEAYKEGFQTARHATALAFMKYLDENRPEGKMCLSNGECEDIEKAFLVGDWEKIERYFHKYQWKPSKEQIMHLAAAIEEPNNNPVLESLYHDLQNYFSYENTH